MPKRSNTERALQAVKRRKEDYKAKRFNGPLNIFNKRKYPKIFEEYTNLFKFIDLVNPGKKNLLKTSTFKQWMKDNPEPVKNLLPTSANRETTTKTAPSVNCETPSPCEMPSAVERETTCECEIPSVNCEIPSSVKHETTTTCKMPAVNCETPSLSVNCETPSVKHETTTTCQQ